MPKKYKSIAFIPARSGSKRVPNKNIKLLGGHPIIAYSIRSAIDSKKFDRVICSTDSEEYADIAEYYGAEVPFLRSGHISKDNSVDYEWVIDMINKLSDEGEHFDIFSILRPTSPFRTKDTIIRAMDSFLNSKIKVDSLRAVELSTSHPGKMWTINNSTLSPLLPFEQNNTPWHSSQTSSLPLVYSQNASLEICWTLSALETKSISGRNILPFITNGLEGFDINSAFDWYLSELIAKDKNDILNYIHQEPYKI